jgi:hypothetical protein
MAKTLDQRLMAKVQDAACARVHEAAGLLQRYSLAVYLANDQRQTEARRAEYAILADQHEAELRKFLVQCLKREK